MTATLADNSPDLCVTPSARCDSDRLRVLGFTSIFPNSAQPRHGLFVYRRIAAMTQRADLRLVAPVPWAPPAPGLPERFYRCSTVEVVEETGPVTVYHPRFVAIPRVLKSVDPVLMAASCLPAVRAIRRHFPFQVIDAHWACPDGVAAALIARACGVPFSITVRGDDLNVFAQERGRRRVIRWALKRAARVIAVSADLAARAIQLGAPHDRVSVIANGVDGDTFRPVERIEARQHLRITPFKRIVLSVGRLHVSKGFPVLVEALGRLGPGYDDVHLVIIGEPDEEADATEAIRTTARQLGLEDRVLLKGAESPERLAFWYNAADVFALATTREGSANVLLEALSCGTPCVTTTVGGNIETVREGISGVFCDHSAEAFADAIRRAMSHSWNRPAIRHEVSHRTWEAVGATCCSQLADVVSQEASA